MKLSPEEYMEGHCGRLKKTMYGTRDAAHRWEYEYVSSMEEIWLSRGAASPCVFFMECFVQLSTGMTSPYLDMRKTWIGSGG